MRPTLLLCALLAASCSASYRPLVTSVGDAADVVLRNATVFTGRDASVLRGHDVWISRGRIAGVFPTGTDAGVPAQARSVDATGMTVLPGLVDSHMHITGSEAAPWKFYLPDTEHNLQAWLYCGITTVFDMGGSADTSGDLEAKRAAGSIFSPHIHFTHASLTGKGAHPIPAVRALLPWPLGHLLTSMMPQVESPEDIDAWLEDVKSKNVRYAKLLNDALPPGTPQMGGTFLALAVERIHTAGMKAFVHIGSNEDALAAARAGADHLAHGVYKGPISDEVIALLKERNVSVTYTAAGFDVTREMALGRYAPSRLAEETSAPEVLASVSGKEGEKFGALETLGDFARGIASREVLLENVRKVHAAGITLLAGSDAPIAAIHPGSALHEELKFFQAAGIPAPEVLLTATGRAARLVEGNPEFGTLEVGKRADVLVVRGDATADVAALQDIVHVFQAGRLVERAGPRAVR